MASDPVVNPLAELAWGGYLSYLHSQGLIPDDPAELWAMKSDFLSGFDPDSSDADWS